MSKNSEPDRPRKLRAVLSGNPNSGKTSIFNQLTGANQKVGNWAGVTVEIREGKARFKNHTFTIVDLPGTYSLAACSMEERVARDYIIQEKPDVVVDVIDSSNLERNLYLTLQLIELQAPMVLAFNMSDEAEKNGLRIDTARLSELLGAPIVPTVGRSGKGLDNLLLQVEKTGNQERSAHSVRIRYPAEIEAEIERIAGLLSPGALGGEYPLAWISLKLLENDEQVRSQIGASTEAAVLPEVDKSLSLIQRALGDDAETLITEARYGFIAGALKETVRFERKGLSRVEMSDRIDRVLTHRFWAFPIFLTFMWLLFHATFQLGEIPVGWMETAIAALGEHLQSGLPQGPLRDLIVDGIIGGVGGVVVFLPNILILFFGISIMEDTGYMARAAFIMDKVMHSLGLHGKSFIPLILGFGCNVPAIMAARTLESRSDRIMTILLAPLVSCSARLPVYVLFAGAFFAHHAGTVIFLMYLIGLLMVFLLGRVFRRFLFRNQCFPFVMELPPYRVPGLQSIIIHMWERAKHYLKKMGSVVLVFSILLWFLGAFPKDESIEARFAAQQARLTEANATAEQLDSLDNEKNAAMMSRTYIGRMGQFIEPVIRPLGFDWRAGVSLVTGFVAKEVVVSSMGVLYATEQGENSISLLGNRLRQSFTPLTAFGFMVFVLLYTPCIVALVTVIRELKSWKWSLFSIGYQIALAWIAAFVIYQGGRLLGIT